MIDKVDGEYVHRETCVFVRGKRVGEKPDAPNWFSKEREYVQEISRLKLDLVTSGYRGSRYREVIHRMGNESLMCGLQ